jgi:hypothetical protein
MNWLLFLSQLPATPSSLRVAVWRRMRAAGALGLQNGVWVLPNKPDQQKLLQDLLTFIQSQGANGQIFTVSLLTVEIEKDILERFRSDRDEEYSEFCERCQEFLGEIRKESHKKKFTFAELEELEQDWQRLEAWLAKIQNRDFLGGKSARKATQLLDAGRTTLEAFSAQVYIHQGLDISSDQHQQKPSSSKSK